MTALLPLEQSHMHGALDYAYDQTVSRGNTPAFLVAEVASSAGGSALEVQLPSGAIVRASDAEQIRLLAALLRHLA